MGSPPSSQNAKGRRLLGPHSRHPWEALIGPHGWQDWAPKRRLKRQGEGAPRAPIPTNSGGPCSPPAGGGNGHPKGARNGKGKAPPGRPFPPPARGLDRPPRVVGLGAQKAPKTPHKMRLLGAYSRYPRGTLISPCGWREWAPKTHPKCHTKGSHRSPILVTRGGP